MALSERVKNKGNNLNRVGTANSVFNRISLNGCIKILLSAKNPEPKPINISLLRYPKNIENIARIIKGKLMKISPSWAGSLVRESL